MGEAALDPEQLLRAIDTPSIHTIVESPVHTSATPDHEHKHVTRPVSAQSPLDPARSAAAGGDSVAGYVSAVRKLAPDPSSVGVRDEAGLVEALRMLAVAHYVTVSRM